MPISSPFVIALTTLEESVLRARARSSRSAHRDVLRARIVLAAAAGIDNTAIAADLGIHVDTVRKWRRRFAASGLPGLDDLPRSGRPRGFTPVQVAQVKALACTLPAETGVPLSRWSSTDLAGEVINRGVADHISPATVRRWLAADAIKPWQHRSWIFPRDPDFETIRPGGSARGWWQARVAAAQGLELGFLIGADDVVVLAESFAFPAAGIQVEHPGGLRSPAGHAARVVRSASQ